MHMADLGLLRRHFLFRGTLLQSRLDTCRAKSEAFIACSNLLTQGLSGTGAFVVALALVTCDAEKKSELAGASAGASLAFIDLCIALAEAPATNLTRKVEIAGLGLVSWKASFSHRGGQEAVVFALQDANAGSFDAHDLNLDAFASPASPGARLN
jgi:hypothetical protein